MSWQDCPGWSGGKSWNISPDELGPHSSSSGSIGTLVQPREKGWLFILAALCSTFEGGSNISLTCIMCSSRVPFRLAPRRDTRLSPNYLQVLFLVGSHPGPRYLPLRIIWLALSYLLFFSRFTPYLRRLAPGYILFSSMLGTRLIMVLSSFSSCYCKRKQIIKIWYDTINFKSNYQNSIWYDNLQSELS